MPIENEIADARQLGDAPLDAEVTLRVLGDCMAPVFHGGDFLRVRRCSEVSVVPGDVVIVRSPTGIFLAHLLLDTTPTRTSPLGGRHDPLPLAILGKVLGINGSGRLFRWPRATRRALLGTHWTLRRLRESRWLSPARSAGSWLRGIRRSRATRQQGIDVRRLAIDDLAALSAFAAQHLSVPLDFLRRQLWGRWQREGVAVGAFRGDGTLCGFVYLDAFTEEGMHIDGWWVRSVFVAPDARRRQLGARLISRLLVEACALGIEWVRADIPAGNQASRRLFASVGFAMASAEWSQRVHDEWTRNGVEDQWIVMERRIDLADDPDLRGGVLERSGPRLDDPGA